jgi:hypothetical protein
MLEVIKANLAKRGVAGILGLGKQLIVREIGKY